MYEYIKQNGWYYLKQPGGRVDMVGATIAVAFDKTEGVLHKHGEPHGVNEWAIQARKKVAAAVPEWASDLVVLEGAFDVGELNKIISISGYIGRFYAALCEKGQTVNTTI